MLAQLTTAKRQLIALAFFDLRDIAPWCESACHNLPWTRTRVETYPRNQFNGHNPRLSLSPSISSYYRRYKMYPPKPQLRFLSEQLIPEAAACFLNPSHAYANASNWQIHATPLKLMWHQWFSIHVGTTHNCKAPTNRARILWSSRYRAMMWICLSQPSMNSHSRGNLPPKPIQWPQPPTIIVTLHQLILSTV